MRSCASALRGGTSAGLTLRASDAAEQSSRVVATDFDARDCPAQTTALPGAGGSTLPGESSPPAEPNTSGTPADYSSEQASASADSGGCDATGFSDSCSGNSSDSSSSDSCSGNSSSDSSSSDSCSGNSSSDSSSSDSCSGDSANSTSDDSAGCGKSNYDGDTCSGNSASSAKPDSQTTAALEPSRGALGSRQHGRPPKRVHLSLLTLLAVMVLLPLRRNRLWRNAGWR